MKLSENHHQQKNQILINCLHVDDEENIYVVDSKEACVMIFNKLGTHIRTIGKKGQGPGGSGVPGR